MSDCSESLQPIEDDFFGGNDGYFGSNPQI